MLNTIRRLSVPVNQICKRCRSSLSTQSKETEEVIVKKWQLFVSVCITRPPIVCPTMTDLEVKYKNLCMEKEFEQSYQSDHELQFIEEKLRAKMIKNTNKEKKTLPGDTIKQTAVEFEDESAAEYNKFEFSPVVTGADKEGDINSLYRALDRSLVLVSHQQLGREKIYMLPQVTWQEGETLRQTCDRLVIANIHPNLKVQIFGNAPCGFYNYKYSKALREHIGFIGAKVFFFSGHVMNLNLKQLNDIRKDEDIWLTHDQLGEKITKSYHNAVKHFLISDF